MKRMCFGLAAAALMLVAAPALAHGPPGFVEHEVTTTTMTVPNDVSDPALLEQLIAGIYAPIAPVGGEFGSLFVETRSQRGTFGATADVNLIAIQIDFRAPRYIEPG